ncbi:MAG: Do family serine endopeptidase [Treponema sp.]|nr:Do family serine endopeptidase [Treponema sp.]
MKKPVKNIATAIAVAALSFGIFNLSCKVNNGSANVAFAESPAVNLPKDSLQVTQSLQDTFRAISANVLPAVVEVDVTETVEAGPSIPDFFKDLPFFFGNPQEGGKERPKREREVSGLGSGVIVRKTDKTFYVLTNFHVAGHAKKISIKLNDEREFEGKLVGGDERMDIALVSFESDDKKIPVVTLGDSSLIQQGDIVLALGSPLGYFASVTQGIVSATGRSGGKIGSISDFIQTDAAINQGNSGGPLVNIYGEVIGINTWIASTSGGSVGLGFSIPINNVKDAIDQFITKGKVVYGWVGISLMDISEDFKDALGIDRKQEGAFASNVFMGSPAMKAGIQAGDFIIELNGKNIKSVDQIVRDIAAIPAGKKAELIVLRGKEKKTVTVTIGERTEETTSDNTKLWPGFTAADLTKENKERIGLNNDNVKGVIVAGLMEKTPGAALKLDEGDVICAVNDKPVKSVEQFYRELDISDKKEIWFDVYREGHVVSTVHYKLQK